MECRNGAQAAVIRDTRKHREPDVRRTAPEGCLISKELRYRGRDIRIRNVGFFRCLLGVKTEFDELLAFLRSRRPFPLSDGVHGGLRQHGVAANHVRHLYFSAGRNYNFHPDDAMDLHLASQFWIHGDHFVHNLPLGFRLFLSRRILSQSQGRGECGRSQK